MPVPPAVADVKQVQVMGGKLLVKEIADATYRDIGVVASFTLNVASTSLELKDSKCALKNIVAKQVVEIAYTAPLVLNTINYDNLKLFLAGITSTVTTASGSGLTEDKALTIGEYAFVNETTSTPIGDANTTINSVTHKAGDAASAHATTTAYVVGDVVIPTAPNLHAYICTVAGTSDSSEPTWPTDGTTVVDATVTWQDVGLIIMAPADYVTLDTDGGFQVVLGTNMIDGQVYTIDYDRAGTERQMVNSGGTIPNVSIKIIGCSSPAAQTLNFEFKEASIEAGGDLSILANEAAYAELPLTATGTKSDLGYEIVYVSGQPVAT